MTGVGLPLDPAPEDMRAMADAVADALIAWIGGLDDAPAAATEGAMDVAARLAASPPEIGSGDFAGLLADALEAARHTFEYSGPGYLAYIPGGGLYTAAVGEFLAQGLNRYVGLWQPSPAIVQLEENVTRWLRDLFAFPPTSQGVLTSGGSMANLSAVVTARHARLGTDFLDGTYYVTDQAHGSNTKAATIAGFGERNLRLVPTDGALRMDPDALAAMIAADRASGLRPFMVMGAAGTTNTGAVDPLDAIADIAEREGLWFHVDAAYGGFFQLTERGRAMFAGAERADSVTLDPHKGLFLPYGTGCLLARDARALRDAHEVHAQYLPPVSQDAGLPDFSSFSPELTRDFRGLRLWLPLHLHGVRAFTDALDDKLDLARLVYERLSALPALRLRWAPQLSLVTFRPARGTDEDTEELLRRINSSGRVWLSSAPVDGERHIRMCILSHRSTRGRIEEAVEIIASAAS